MNFEWCKMCEESAVRTNSACIMFPSQSRHYKRTRKARVQIRKLCHSAPLFFFPICGFFLQLPPLFLSFSISLRQQSANGPVFILLQLRKKTLCFSFSPSRPFIENHRPPRRPLTASQPPAATFTLQECSKPSTCNK